MGDKARITINGHEVISWEDTYKKWYFIDDEKIYQIGDLYKNGTNEFIGYRSSVATIKRRLKIDGYDLRSAEIDFNETRSVWIKDIKNITDQFKNDIKSTDDAFKKHIIDKLIPVLELIKNTDFNQWFKALSKKLSQSNDSAIFTSPLDKLMSGILYGVDIKNYGVARGLFPCSQVETYAVILCELSNDDDICELDLKTIINDIKWIDFLDFDSVRSKHKTQNYIVFEESLSELIELNNNDTNPLIKRMIFSSVIAAMEAFLSDTLKRSVLNRRAVQRRFVENYASFDKNMKESQIFRFMDDLDKRIINEIDKMLFHNMSVVKEIYKNVLFCDLKEDLVSKIIRYVLTRHDIVHRNGKGVDGSVLLITMEEVSGLINTVNEFVRDIDKQIIDGLLDARNDQH